VADSRVRYVVRGPDGYAVRSATGLRWVPDALDADLLPKPTAESQAAGWRHDLGDGYTAERVDVPLVEVAGNTRTILTQGNALAARILRTDREVYVLREALASALYSARDDRSLDPWGTREDVRLAAKLGLERADEIRAEAPRG